MVLPSGGYLSCLTSDHNALMGVGTNFSRGGGGGVVYDATFQKGFILPDFFPNTLFRKCIKKKLPLCVCVCVCVV